MIRLSIQYFIFLTIIFLCSCVKTKYVPIQLPTTIVSFAPSITETLFALGLGERIVGVTSYCLWPKQTANIEKIGSYATINAEKVITLNPDIIILQKHHVKQQHFFEGHGIRTLVVDIETISEICSTFAVIGRMCGVSKTADSLIGCFESFGNTFANSSSSLSVLLCVGRDSPGSGSVKSVYVASASTFYNDLIVAAGGRNAFVKMVPKYPKLSQEGIIALAPDIIIDVAPAMGDYNCNTLIADWKSLAMIPAIDNENVYCISADYATIPGPRLLNLLDDFSLIIESCK